MVKKIKIKRKYKLLSILIIFTLLILIIYFGLIDKNNDNNSNLTKDNIISNYNKYVITNKETTLYDENKNEVGKIGSGIELELNNQIVENGTKYFSLILNGANYNVYYKDLDKIDKLSKIDTRYKKYILFNKNIVTSNKTSFYDENDNLVYEINNSFDLPIIINEENKYGVEFNNRLLYVLSGDVKKVKYCNNTDKKNISGIPVLNYHFVHEDDDYSCTEEICHSASQIKEHFIYINNNNIFTITMKELEKYIDNKIQLPKSIVITFDDGGYAEVARKYVDMYEINATLFLITSWFNKDEFESEYLEVHSHGDNLHNTGACPGGQGGAIKCLEKDKLLNDLKLSREKLDWSTVFCYPFYEFNNYSIEILKEAGFTMAFAGEYAGGDYLVRVNSDKYRLPRWVIVNWTTNDQFMSYVNGGE